MIESGKQRFGRDLLGNANFMNEGHRSTSDGPYDRLPAEIVQSLTA